MQLVPFQTRARTIDHLGRGQIADCPTAVSELWKNAYDAYASTVALHIFDGAIPISAVVDDGHGMNRDEFMERWLVVGTESKLSAASVSELDRNGLPPRERQGEKGIGRLSVAYLGPAVLVLSKRRGRRFVSSLVDWRLFENPYLMLGDVRVPVEEFTAPEEFGPILSTMLARVMENVRGGTSDAERDERVRNAWERHTEVERRSGTAESTAEAIERMVGSSGSIAGILLNRCLAEWPVWSGEREHGTALFVLDIHHELGVWVDPTVARDDSEVEAIRESLRDTLSGFTDPYLEEPIPFDYRVVVHRGSMQDVIVSTEHRFDLDDLKTLEHFVIGRFDEQGVFRGRAKAFGHDIGEFSLPPARVPSLKPSARVGPFEVCVGTFEQEIERSTHPPEQHLRLKNLADLYAGLAIYRNGLRVMPYGRPQADFFGIEERRSFHAGRAFWSYRRTFGRVALSRIDNPNLRDKAGREGLIDNRAKRELRILVVDLLKQTANRYFNLESQPYKEYLPQIIAANKAAREAEDRSKKRRADEFTRALRSQSESVRQAVRDAELAKEELQRIIASGDGPGLTDFEQKLEALRIRRADLRLPAKPAKLGRMEEPYRDYRDAYQCLSATTDEISKNWAEAMENLHTRPPDEEVRSALGKHQAFLISDLKTLQSKIQKILKAEMSRVDQLHEEDRGRFYQQAAPLVADVTEGKTTLAVALRRMEELREDLHDEFQLRYGAYLRSLEQLSEGIDLDAAVVWSMQERESLQSQVEQLHSLAQLGITVEIVGHELEQIDSEITKNLKRLPEKVRTTAPYRDVVSAHKSLVDRLRFLSPMKLSGPRTRESISGERIAEYVEEFFSRRLQSTGTRFAASTAFRGLRVREFPSRLFPVFINLVNNSLYWVTFRDKREILFDLVEDSVVVADTGPGIDPDDRPMLFRLFFSRRVEGRGVGLYLCRANLAAGGHTIEYASDPKYRVLEGANFVIRFQGSTYERA